MSAAAPTPAKATKTPRQRELAMIHIARKQLGLDEETYRAMLRSVGRVDSSRDLDGAGRRRVLEHLQARGFVVPGKVKRRQQGDPQLAKIAALWADLAARRAIRDGSEPALRAFVRRQTGVGAPEWLSTAQCIKVIEALKGWVKRLDQPDQATED